MGEEEPCREVEEEEPVREEGEEEIAPPADSGGEPRERLESRARRLAVPAQRALECLEVRACKRRAFERAENLPVCARRLRERHEQRERLGAPPLREPRQEEGKGDERARYEERHRARESGRAGGEREGGEHGAREDAEARHGVRLRERREERREVLALGQQRAVRLERERELRAAHELLDRRVAAEDVRARLARGRSRAERSGETVAPRLRARAAEILVER